MLQTLQSVRKAGENIVAAKIRHLQRRRRINRNVKRGVGEHLSVSSDGAGLRIIMRATTDIPYALVLLVDDEIVSRINVTVVDESNTGLKRVEAHVPYSLFASLQHPFTHEPLTNEHPAVVRCAWLIDFSSTAKSENSLNSETGIPARAVGVIRGGKLIRRRNLAGSVEKADESVSFVGRAENTDIDALSTLETVEVSGVCVSPYINRRGQVSINVGAGQLLHSSIYAHAITIEPWGLSVTGRIFSSAGNLEGAEFRVLSRQTGNGWSVPLDLQLDKEWTSKDYGRRHYRYVARLRFPEDAWESFDAMANYDAWVYFPAAVTDRPLRRVNKVPFLTRITAESGVVKGNHGYLAITSYFTFKAKALSFIFEPLSEQQLKFVEMNADYRSKSRAVSIRRPDGTEKILAEPGQEVWLIGEQPHRAQDNGLALYRWMREEHPEIAAYYVIDESSPDACKFDSDDRVVFHRSTEHFALSMHASRFVGTHHPEYLFPSKFPPFVRKLNGTRIFLQHGVMGTKWMAPTYGKRSPGFNVDRFFVSSELEKQMIVDDFGYSPDEVVITGLSRFDTLLTGEPPSKPRQIIVMPTWRDWLQTDDTVAESDYLKAWVSLLSSDRFAAIVRDNKLDVVLHLHTNMRRFAHLFSDLPVRLIEPGEVEVQTLLRESSLMITDYSSVGFDFSFQHRPVIYYQFDRNKFLGKWGSHLDLDEQLPGYIAQVESGVLSEFERLAECDFTQEPGLAKRAAAFLHHRDRSNSKRVFNAIEAAPKQSSVRSEGELRSLPTALVNRVRRSKFYFPMMRAYYRLLSSLPGPRETLVFESGQGKQYSDSPRYIYEELLRRGDRRPKIWIYSGPKKFRDANTSTVKRLSPQYFAALARARYWTMNQSAPSYLQRPEKTRFVQTWHGTPLKRMQFDMVDVNAQDSDYINRAQAGVRQWTHLISPSAYATEAFRSAFRFRGPIIEKGYPRNDPLVFEGASSVRDAVRRSLGLDEDDQIILYAPTFRDDQARGKSKFEFELPLNLEKFVQQMPPNSVLLIRLHSLVADSIEIPEKLIDRVRDVSSYPEIQELYLASDVLITDYSSVFFDFALLGRPIVFYAYDLENYRDNLRGFYLDYETDLPGPIVTKEEELWSVVADGIENGIDQQRRAEFLERFAPMDDGHASSRIVDELY